MKVTYNWLKEFVDITLSPDELADKLTMAGLEVEAGEKKDGDVVYTIEVTSNRPDWLSVVGIAREVAAITGKQLKLPKTGDRAGSGGQAPAIAIDIEDTNDCPLYTARTISGVKVGPSPEWMRRRLELIGVRPVNNIVDITNYVLFELGEPLHAFDLAQLSRGTGTAMIAVRRARAGEKITAIDGKDYVLGPGELVIADGVRPVAIAGVMGGKDTEVSSATKDVLLEAALFNAIVVRRGRQRLGMGSEASYRFERGIDPAAPEQASLRAAQLMAEIAGGVTAAAGARGGHGGKTREVILDAGRACSVLGIDIPPVRVKDILAALGFSVTSKGDREFIVGVPSFRQDIKADIDLIEDIARVYGFDNVPSCLPSIVIRPAQARAFDDIVKEAMIGQGLDEVLTYSLIDKKYITGFYAGTDLVEVANPLSNEQEILRPVMMPSLAKIVAYNLNRRQSSVSIFEIARVYKAPDREYDVLGIAVSGVACEWFGEEAVTAEYKKGFLNLKGIIDTLLSRIGIDASGVSLERSYEYKDDNTVLLKLKNSTVGTLKKLTSEELDLFEIKGKDVFLAELAMDELRSRARLQKVFKPFPAFPSVTRDITLDMSGRNKISTMKMFEIALKAGQPLLRKVSTKRFWKKDDADIRKFTISCEYAASDRTLTEAEVTPVHAAVVEALKA